MGRDIVRKECPKDPGKRSRLWLHKDIDNVLTKNTGTEAIQGIVLISPRSKQAHWNPMIKKSTQGLSPNYGGERYDVVFPGSEIPECCLQLECQWKRYGYKEKKRYFEIGISDRFVAVSDHIWLSYVLPQYFLEKDEKSLWEYDANGFRGIGIKISNSDSSLVKKCGLRVVYKKDIEDLNRNVVQCSNNSIIPYEGLKESLNLWPMLNIVRSEVSTRNVVKS
ncbi:hypothetical protein CMV_019831 [Castanea mollissima]|uniref:Uncharacterized protein n=1 Tax=Castanea mollissima TaxID=60419 RepID=A0A8J4VN88_9ROSI|nr:hypothetical protein CMV_019831 [Castanea mollissima]